MKREKNGFAFSILCRPARTKKKKKKPPPPPKPKRGGEDTLGRGGKGGQLTVAQIVAQSREKEGKRTTLLSGMSRTDGKGKKKEREGAVLVPFPEQRGKDEKKGGGRGSLFCSQQRREIDDGVEGKKGGGKKAVLAPLLCSDGMRKEKGKKKGGNKKLGDSSRGVCR